MAKSKVKEKRRAEQELLDNLKTAGFKINAEGFDERDSAFMLAYCETAWAFLKATQEVVTYDSIVKGLRAAYVVFDWWMKDASAYTSKVGGKGLRILSCRRGCNWCCYERPETGGIEALVAVAAIRRLPELKRAEILKKAMYWAEEIALLSAEELVDLKRLCPLNENGACVIYDARPLPCRAMHSYSEQKCRSISDGALVGRPQSAIRAFATAACAQGLSHALGHRGLVNASSDLNTLIRILTDDDHAISRLLAGDSEVLGTAVRPDVEEILDKEVREWTRTEGL